MKKLILYMGLHKTGTTVIQRACRENLRVLTNAGYYYPLPNIQIHKPDPHPENHTKIFMLLFKSGKLYWPGMVVSDTSRLELKQTLKNNFEKNEKSMICVAETISALNKNDLLQLKEFFSSLDYLIEPICVLRKPYSWLTSMIAQRTSGKFEIVVTLPESIMEFKSRGAIYRDRIENIKSTLPNTSFVSFNELIQNRRGPAGWFLEKIGVNAIVSDIKTNESISDHSVRLASKINQNAQAHGLLGPAIYNLGIKKFPALTQIPGEKFYLREFEITPLKHILIEENEWLKDTFGKDFYDDEINFKNEPVTLNNEQRQFMIDHLSSIPEPIIQFAVKDYLNKH